MFSGEWQQVAQPVVHVPCFAHRTRQHQHVRTLDVDEGHRRRSGQRLAVTLGEAAGVFAHERQPDAVSEVHGHRYHVTGVTGDRERATTMVRGFGELSGQQRPGRVQPV
jgi:hypothetical protein